MRRNRAGLGHRLGAVLAAVALSVVGMAGAAHAEDDAPASPLANINPQAPASLTIHKYDGDQGTAGDGTELSDTTGLGNPLGGVTFTITPVTAKNGTSIDLSTAAGWDAFKGASAADVTEANGYDFGLATTAVTGTTAPNIGVVTKTLPQGLYLVTETDPGTNSIISPVEPFLVTLPLPNANGNGSWIYDVHVYPKNKVNTTNPTKTASNPTKVDTDDASYTLGSEIDWTITAPVPALANGDTYKSFVITDVLDSRLGYVGASVADFTASTDGGATGDYTIAYAAATNTVTITFTTNGVAKLEAGEDVIATITTTVDSLGNGVIKNKATVTTNGSPRTTGEPSSNWGALHIKKYAAGDKADVLAGAVFEVYADSALTQLVTTVTTNSSGLAAVDGLWVGNNTDTTQQYWLKEIQAPAGYVLPSNPVNEVTVTAGSDSAAYLAEISNTQQTGVSLPLTGADGQRLLMIGGLGLLAIAAGGGLLVVSRRRSHNS